MSRKKKAGQEGGSPTKLARTEIESWMIGTEIHHTADYASRGRLLEKLTSEELSARFVDAYRRLASSPTSPEALRDMKDARSEYSLRGSNPPDHLVRSEMDRFLEGIATAFEQMKSSDPAGWKEANRAMTRDIISSRKKLS
jgi:hypothetical protein